MYEILLERRAEKDLQRRRCDFKKFASRFAQDDLIHRKTFAAIRVWYSSLIDSCKMLMALPIHLTLP